MKSKQLCRGASFSATAYRYLCKYGGRKKLKYMNLVCHGDANK